ncbi:MAG: A/G-specific adenine glycosylase [Verrucomicrobia bacterium]|nr:A/G-specific adenine glycosylase [Verrucomicrobiota bacterium]
MSSASTFNHASARADLRDWYLVQQRPLPWRQSPSVYATVVSEFMCQQTQIVTVLPYFAQWMAQWPDFESLATATEEQVLAAWQGLGYYSRAKRLQAVAVQWCAAELKPQTAAAWLEYPGIGPYTAAAIASIHFRDPVAAVDGNVIRVLSRLVAAEDIFNSQQSAVTKLTPEAQRLLDHDDPGTHNQAMMELGALVCTKAKPSCLMCPLQSYCRGFALGHQDKLPRILRAAITERAVNRAWCVSNGRLLLQRYPAGSRRLAGVCELPELERLSEKMPDAVIASLQRGISNERIRETLRVLPVLDATKLHLETEVEWVWVSEAELSQTTLSGPHRKWIENLLKDYPLCLNQAYQK